MLCSPRATAIYVLFFSIVFAGLAVLLGVWTPAAFWLCAGVFGGGIAVAVVGGLTTLSLSIYYLRSLCNNRWPWAPTQKAGAGVEEDDSRRARVLAMSQLRASTSADGSADAYRVAPLIDSTSPFSKDPSFVSLASGVGPSGTAGVGARSDGGGCCRCGFPCVLRSFASTLCVLSVIIALVATGIVGFLRVRTLPDLTSPSLNVGPTAVSGLAAPSTILREQGTGILHISAQSEADLSGRRASRTRSGGCGRWSSSAGWAAAPSLQSLAPAALISIRRCECLECTRLQRPPSPCCPTARRRC